MAKPIPKVTLIERIGVKRRVTLQNNVTFFCDSSVCVEEEDAVLIDFEYSDNPKGCAAVMVFRSRTVVGEINFIPVTDIQSSP